jgi:long-chain acyl-CoA synthetase
MTLKAPWLKHYGDVPHTLNYPDCSISQLVFSAAQKYPDYIAYNFFGCKKSYRKFYDEILLCADGLLAIGIQSDDRVTICMPNTPQAVIMFYALNHIGAVATMVHPLSAEEELVRFINSSSSVAVLTLYQFADKLSEILPRTGVRTLFLCGIEDGLSGIKKPLYLLTKGRKIKRRPAGSNIITYTDLLERGRLSRVLNKEEHIISKKSNDVAAILYSGGTSGTSKGILLTNLNINALAMQTAAAGNCVVAGNKMLAIIPMFHGFGLGVCVHTALISGCTTILIPQFSVKTYAKLLKKLRPHYIAGVPALFEALLRLENTGALDFSQFMGIFSGGDSLSVELKRKIDIFMKARASHAQVRAGPGLTECVSASCLTPRYFHKEGSIGIPYPDMYFKIVQRGTLDEAPYSEEGEIVLTGPTVMKGYDGNDEETANALKTHADGFVWLHTGDLGMMDEEGFVYFRQRIKRLIISSGFNIYPSQLENAIELHDKVLISCVIGIPDERRGRSLKAFIVLHDGLEATDEIKESIMEHCRRNIAKYAMPREFEYRKSLPRTLVGKVAYLELEKETKVSATGGR